MNKVQYAAALATSLILASAASVGAVEGQISSGKSYVGEVMTTSPAAHTITVRHGNSTQTFRVDKETKLSTSTKATSNADLKNFEMGEKVTVQYKEESNGQTALSVREDGIK